MEENTHQFSVKKRLFSFKYAFNGFVYMIRTQHNSRIHLVAGIIAIILGFWLNNSVIEWCLISFAIGIVLLSEMMNTAIEYITDLISPDYNEKAGRIKDLAAGGVLISAITAAIIGLLIYLPKIYVLTL